MPGADVGGHDDDRVFEVDGVAEAVGELAIFKDLQQDVEDVGMRLFDFVEQDDRVGRTLDALGELTALLVAHVARRRTDELRDRVLLHELRHIEADQRLLAAEEEAGEGARHLRLADAGRSEEEERSDGAVGALEAGTGAADRAGEGRDGLLLRDDAAVQLFFDAEQLLRLFFLDRRDGNAGPAADHVLDVFAADDAGGRVVEVVFVAKGAQVLALLALFVGVEARLLEFMVRDGVFHAVNDELDPLLDLGDLLGQRSLAQLDARAGLVDEVDGLVGQEAVGNVAARVRDGEVDRIVGVADRVELLVAVLDAHDDPDRVFFVGRRDLDGLEAAFERAVLLDRLAILGRRGCADALYFAAGERRLEDVRGVERTLSRSGADEGMQLVDEDDGVLVLHQLLHDGLEPLFELAAVLGAGDDERQIERENALVGEEARNVAVGNLLRQALDDGRLADAGLADEDGIVLGPAAEDLDDALEFLIAADQRIELVVHGGLGQVARKLGQQARFAVARASRRRSLLLVGPRQLFADGEQLQSALVQYLGGEALLFAQQSEQQVFRADVFVREPLGLFGGVSEHSLAFIRERQVDRGRDLLADRGVALDLLADRFDRSMGAQKTVG